MSVIAQVIHWSAVLLWSTGLTCGTNYKNILYEYCSNIFKNLIEKANFGKISNYWFCFESFPKSWNWNVRIELCFEVESVARGCMD